MASSIGAPAQRTPELAPKQKVEEKKKEAVQAKPKEEVQEASADNGQPEARSAKDDQSTVSRVA